MRSINLFIYKTRVTYYNIEFLSKNIIVLQVDNNTKLKSVSCACYIIQCLSLDLKMLKRNYKL